MEILLKGKKPFWRVISKLFLSILSTPHLVKLFSYLPRLLPLPPLPFSNNTSLPLICSKTFCNLCSIFLPIFGSKNFYILLFLLPHPPVTSLNLTVFCTFKSHYVLIEKITFCLLLFPLVLSLLMVSLINISFNRWLGST